MDARSPVADHPVATMTDHIISQSLEDELTGELRRRGIVVWLDKEGAYTSFVDGLAARRAAGTFPFPVVGFRGSFLDAMLALEPYGSGLDPSALLIHLPGFNEESVRETPVYELYEAGGGRYRKAFETLVRETARGRVAPDVIEAFLATGAHTVEAADAWIVGQLSSAREGLAATLDRMGVEAVLDALATRHSTLLANAFTSGEVEVLQAFLQKHTGMDDAWLAFYPRALNVRPERNVGNALIGYVLCVEYAFDLNRDPNLDALKVLRKLTPALRSLCVKLVQHLRARHPEEYIAHADEVEGYLVNEIASFRAEDLGRIDTFRVEEARVLEAAIGSLRASAWSRAAEWAKARHGDASFWLERDQTRRWAWTLVAEAAALGEAITSQPQPLDGARTLDEAVERYVERGAAVDRAHRRFEQQRQSKLDPRMPHFGDLQEIVGQLRRVHRGWADQLARDWATLCRSAGFLPTSGMQQRALYEEVVHPLAANGKVALFMVDAFRFEMATELAEAFRSGSGVVTLKPRLAELPTLTSVGMNALAPVAKNGRLELARSGQFSGFRMGEFAVTRPEDRVRAMGVRTGGPPPVVFDLTALGSMDEKAVARKIKGANLIVVHGREIDDAGEANLGPMFFEKAITNLTAAYHLLQAADVKQFVFTADHGFLLQDETTEVVPFGTVRVPSRRHVLDDHPRQERNLLVASMEALGYDGSTGFVLLRDDTAVFNTGKPGTTFVHGGNSLQERVIPVLSVTLRTREGAPLTRYSVEASALPDLVGHRRLRLRVRLAQASSGTLGFTEEPRIDVAIRAVGANDVRVIVRDTSGGGTVQQGRLSIPIGEAWTEVFFVLEGPRDERAQVEVYHPQSSGLVQPAIPDAWFAVVASASVAAAPSTPGTSRAGSDWIDAIADEGARKVFVHLSEHGSITEAEMNTVLGSPRAARRFALVFDEYVERLPFRVRIEGAADGKRYVREGEK